LVLIVQKLQMTVCMVYIRPRLRAGRQSEQSHLITKKLGQKFAPPWQDAVVVARISLVLSLNPFGTKSDNPTIDNILE
jgi:hypothetical protein